MVFKMWSWHHILYIFSPFLVAIALYFTFANKSEKAKWICALVLAIINVANLIVRNIDVLLVLGRMDAEIIPLALCHFANFIFLVAVITKKQSWYILAWCLNLPFGMLAIIFANSLTTHATIWSVRPMAYIIGHLFLVVSVLYVYMIGFTKPTPKAFKKAMVYGGIWLTVSIIVNLIYNNISGGQFGTANYMYLVKPEQGTPLTILFRAGKDFYIGKATFNPVYILLVALTGVVVSVLMYFLHNALKRLARFKKQSG